MFGREWVDNAGTLYCLDKDVVLQPRLPGVTISNGLVWKDAEFYYIDTPTKRVDRYVYDAVSGTISDRTTAVTFPADGSHGFPDGMVLDADGNIWIACFNVSVTALRRSALPDVHTGFMFPVCVLHYLVSTGRAVSALQPPHGCTAG